MVAIGKALRAAGQCMRDSRLRIPSASAVALAAFPTSPAFAQAADESQGRRSAEEPPVIIDTAGRRE